MSASAAVARTPRHTTNSLPVSTKILIGGLGALTPILLNLLVVDYTFLKDITGWVLAGYAVRVLALFFLGGLVAYLHSDERNRVKLFELGLTAPALITGMMNASNARDHSPSAAVKTPTALSMMLVTSVHAQTVQPAQVRRFTIPQESKAEQFWRGVTGSQNERAWYVVVNRYATLSEAQQRAHQINTQRQGLQAEVYEPYGDSRLYSVVVGANLTLGEARQLRITCVAAGYPDANVWTPPTVGKSRS